MKNYESMRILWFSVTPSLFSEETNQYNGLGWIASLERIISSRNDINLGIAFVYNKSSVSTKITKGNGVTYYPMYIKRTFLDRQKDRFSYKYIDKATLNACIKVIEDFNPDLIQIFGSEWCFGLLYQYTQKPIVIHMQGSWPPIRNAQYPPGFSISDEIIRRLMKPKALFFYLLSRKLSKEHAQREEKILKNTHFFMGRTRWDYALTQLYAPNSNYYLCNEALREDFIKNNWRWQPHEKREKILFVTVGGGHYIKGYDLVLKTAHILKENSKLNFEWKLLGPTSKDLANIEKKTGIKSQSVNVFPLGKKSASDVKDILLDSDLYIHTSYIDNSPNSICEAQYLGLPVITTNVGGIISLFDPNYDSNLFIPVNDPYFLAFQITSLISDYNRMKKLSLLNYTLAQDRHADENISNQLYSIYTHILNKQ